MDLKRVAVGLAALTVVGALACSDGLTRPGASGNTDDDFAMSGVIVSSLMRADGGANAHISSISTEARFGGSGNAQNFVGSPTPITVDPSEANALRTQAVTPTKLAITGSSGLFDRTTGGRPSLVRPRAKGRSFKNRKDGKEIEVQFVDDPRGGDRPPAAMVTWLNGRAASVNQYTYRKIGKSWVPTSSRTTIYDSTGRAAFVASNTYSAMTVSASSLNSLGSDALAGGVGKLVTALGRLVQPDVLYAETVADDIDAGCGMKAAAAAGAEFAWLTAVAALATAWTACATTIIECPAIVAAQAALAVADYYFGKAQAEYALCLQQQQPAPPPAAPAPVAGDGSKPQGDQGGVSCGVITWEISYDDGESWNYLGTSTTC
jgi:hypothetical protein